MEQDKQNKNDKNNYIPTRHKLFKTMHDNSVEVIIMWIVAVCTIVAIVVGLYKYFTDDSDVYKYIENL